jgi:hypothetical protein
MVALEDKGRNSLNPDPLDLADTDVVVAAVVKTPLLLRSGARPIACIF